ncbi:hypothetical protein THIX_60212 [Thiomonas sp. X19]|nr:hypothetical protein THIX_60212 [Thiomonas sp. X19]
MGCYGLARARVLLSSIASSRTAQTLPTALDPSPEPSPYLLPAPAAEAPGGVTTSPLSLVGLQHSRSPICSRIRRCTRGQSARGQTRCRARQSGRLLTVRVGYPASAIVLSRVSLGRCLLRLPPEAACQLRDGPVFD